MSINISGPIYNMGYENDAKFNLKITLIKYIYDRQLSIALSCQHSMKLLRNKMINFVWQHF